jgi:hypothetical protein
MLKRLKITAAAVAGLLALGFGGAALAGATQGSGSKSPAKTTAAKSAPAAADTETNDGPDQQGEHLDPGEKAGGPETPDANEKPDAGETTGGADTDNVQQ